jgi:probable phosphoglycerate mutase
VERAVFARHGESEYSARSLMNGDPGVRVGLTALGREQARALGRELARTRLDLCVTSEFERTILTADEAVGGRGLSRLELPELGDPDYGMYEGRTLDEYRAWAASVPSSEQAPGGGESRLGLIARYAFALRVIAERPERSLLVVAHSLPIALLLAAAEGSPPRPRAQLIPYATPYRVERAELEGALGVVEAWLDAPDW